MGIEVRIRYMECRIAGRMATDTITNRYKRENRLMHAIVAGLYESAP